MVNTARAPEGEAIAEPSVNAANVQLASYMEQKGLGGAAQAVLHVVRRNSAVFDKRVLRSITGEVTFKEGRLVQVYDATQEMTFTTTRKMVST